jgi:hypothetical protein
MICILPVIPVFFENSNKWSVIVKCFWKEIAVSGFQWECPFPHSKYSFSLLYIKKP